MAYRKRPETPENKKEEARKESRAELLKILQKLKPKLSEYNVQYDVKYFPSVRHPENFRMKVMVGMQPVVGTDAALLLFGFSVLMMKTYLQDLPK